MPTAARRPCPVSGCPHLIEGGEGRCRAHRSLAEQRRGSRIARGYDAAWLALRARFMAQPENQLCRPCLERKVITLAVECDHIVPFRNRDDPNRLAWSNLQPICVSCHRKKTADQSSRRGGAVQS